MFMTDVFCSKRHLKTRSDKNVIKFGSRAKRSRLGCKQETETSFLGDSLIFLRKKRML